MAGQLNPYHVLHAQVRRNFRFDPGEDFEFEGIGGRGNSGQVYVYKHNGKRYGIKVSIDGVNLQPEYRLLQALRGGLHVINVHAQSPDPLISLNNEIPRANNVLRWFYMEWAENGTLEEFLDDYDEKFPDRILPCYLLRRFFMCLARQCLEMAYYDKRVPLGTSRFHIFEPVRPGRLVHRDLRPENIVLGDWIRAQPPEHVATPILKLTDFGDAVQRPSALQAVRENIRDIGIVMKLILMRNPGLPNAVGQPTQVTTAGGETFDSYCHPMSYFHRDWLNSGVDRLLLDLVYKCLAVDPAQRPDLIELLETIHEQIIDSRRHAIGSQSDNYVQRLISAVILEPNDDS